MIVFTPIFSQNLVVSSLLCGSPGLGRMKSRPTPAPASAEGMTSIITSHENKIIFFTCKKLYINQCKSQLFCFCSQLPLLNFGSAGCLFDPHALETRTLQVQRQPFHLASTPSASLAGSESFVHINLRCIAICPFPLQCSRTEQIETRKLDDGWPESEKDVFQAALSMVVVKDSR